MLAGVRFRFVLLGLLALFVACAPVQAQINGVPASVTSYGFGGRTNPNPGVRASVTSLGPNGYGSRVGAGSFLDCCYNFFMPAEPNPPLFSGRRHHHGERGPSAVEVVEPVYIPYAVPYAEEDDDDPAEVEPVRAPGHWNTETPAKRGSGGDMASRDAGGAEAPAKTEEPVVAQPSTVLVFKDGHTSDVLNYAIVGDTLFDFGLGRTHKIPLADLDLPATRKANDDRGVEFKVPASANRQ